MHKVISLLLYKRAAAATATAAAIPTEAPTTQAEASDSLLGGGVEVGLEVVLVVMVLPPVGA